MGSNLSAHETQQAAHGNSSATTQRDTGLGSKHSDSEEAEDENLLPGTRESHRARDSKDSPEKSAFQKWKEENQTTQSDGTVGTTLEQQIELASRLWNETVGNNSCMAKDRTKRILEALQKTPVGPANCLVSWKGVRIGWFLNVFCKTPYMQKLLEFGCELWFVRKVCIIEIIQQAHWATNEGCNDNVVPILSGPFVNFVDMVLSGSKLGGSVEEIVKTPTTFLSYTGGYTLQETLDLLGQLDPDEIIWMDVFCVNQFAWTGKSRSPEMKQFKNSFLGDLENQIQEINNTALILGDWKDVMATLSQIWVLWEIFCTAEASSDLSLVLPPQQTRDFVLNCLESNVDFDGIMTSLASIDVKQARAEDDAERQDIFARMQEVGLSRVNNMVSGAVRAWLYQKGQEYLAERRGSKDGPSFMLLNNLATLLKDQGKLEEADLLFREALENHQKVLGHGHPATLTSLRNLASLLQVQGKLEEAEPLFRECLESSKNVLGYDHPDTITSLNNLASLLHEQGSLQEAEPLFQEALEKRREVLGHDHPDTLTTLNDMASLFRAQGKLGEAGRLYREALEKRQTVFGHDHPSTLASLNNLAGLLRAQGMLKEAEPLYLETLEKQQKVLGHGHPGTLGCLNNLAELLRDQGKLKEAEPLFREALEKQQEVLGHDHSVTLTSLNNLAGLLRTQGRLDEAEPLFQKALEKRQRVLGHDHPETLTSLNDLAVLFDGQKKFEKAEPLFQEVLKKQEKVLGCDHPYTLVALSNLALLLRNQGKLEEAESLYRKAVEQFQKVLGCNHPSTIVSKWNLALLLYQRGGGCLEESKALLSECKTASLTKLGTDHPHTIAIHKHWDDCFG